MARFLPLYETPPVAALVATPGSVRISLTDRCDLACVYCRPSRRDGHLEDLLDRDAVLTLIEGLLHAGIRRVRFTGGEPLLSPHVVDAIRHAKNLGATDIALTTNGTQLAALAPALRSAGLQRLTLSLDSLEPACFERLTRGGKLARVLAGLDAARAVGFDEIKLNCVVLRGENDDELEAITRFAWARGLVPRFIEVMPIAEGARIAAERLVPAREVLERLAHLLEPGNPVQDPLRGPAKYLRSRHDPSLRVGIITGSTDTFCEGCDRLRVSANGVLRPCLAHERGVSVARSASGGEAEGVANAVAEAWKLKPDGRTWRGCTEPEARNVSMRAIGG